MFADIFQPERLAFGKLPAKPDLSLLQSHLFGFMGAGDLCFGF